MDLSAPLYSALAARLYIDTLSANTSTIEQQAEVWAYQYNTEGLLPSTFTSNIPSDPPGTISMIG